MMQRREEKYSSERKEGDAAAGERAGRNGSLLQFIPDERPMTDRWEAPYLLCDAMRRDVM